MLSESVKYPLNIARNIKCPYGVNIYKVESIICRQCKRCSKVYIIPIIKKRYNSKFKKGACGKISACDDCSICPVNPNIKKHNV